MITLTCDRPGHTGIFTYRVDDRILLALSRLDLKRLVPDLPDDQMTVEVDFSY